MSIAVESAAIGAVLLAITWWRGAPLDTGAGGALTDAGRLVGLLAGYVAVLQVLLRARLPFIERGLGTDRINTTHAVLGPYLLVLIAAHVSLVTAGYSAASGESLTGQLATLVTSFPYVAWAAVGSAVLLVVGAVSHERVRRRMRYEWWHLMHLAAYAALALVFFHQVTIGEHFRHDNRLRWAWTALFAGTATLVVASRLAKPLWLAARHRFVVRSVEPVTADVVLVRIAGRRLDRLRLEPGQYFRWRFLARGAWSAANPYSVTATSADELHIAVSMAGDHSAKARALRPGTRVIAEGPSGGFGVVPDAPALLVAGGIGITPLRAILATRNSMAPTTVVYRVSKDDDLAFRCDLDRLAGEGRGRLHYIVGARGSARTTLSPTRLRALCPELADAHVYICGSAGFVTAVRAAVRAAGVPRARVHHESFRM